MNKWNLWSLSNTIIEIIKCIKAAQKSIINSFNGKWNIFSKCLIVCWIRGTLMTSVNVTPVYVKLTKSSSSTWRATGTIVAQVVRATNVSLYWKLLFAWQPVLRHNCNVFAPLFSFDYTGVSCFPFEIILTWVLWRVSVHIYTNTTMI